MYEKEFLMVMLIFYILCNSLVCQLPETRQRRKPKTFKSCINWLIGAQANQSMSWLHKVWVSFPCVLIISMLHTLHICSSSRSNIVRGWTIKTLVCIEFYATLLLDFHFPSRLHVLVSCERYAFTLLGPIQ